MVAMVWRGAVLVAALIVAGGACKRDREIDGVGQYSLVHTTLADAPGVCSKDGDLTWCHSNPGIAFGEQRATVDLYFRGEGDDAPLVEILLAINRCRPASVEGILGNQLGDPDVRNGSLVRWDGTYAVTFAQLDKGQGACEINIVSPKDTERIAALTSPSNGDETNEAEGSDSDGAGEDEFGQAGDDASRGDAP